MFRSMVFGCVGVFTLLSSAEGGIIYHSTLAGFQSQGNILNTLDFDSYPTGNSVISGKLGELEFLTSPYTVIIGTAVPAYQTVRAVSVSPFFSTQIIGVESVTTQYSMLAFQMGFVNQFNNNGSGSIQITTNLASYSLGNFGAQSASTGLTFAGFTTTDAAEFITGFQVSPNFDPTGGSPGLTAFQLGQLATS